MLSSGQRCPALTAHVEIQVQQAWFEGDQKTLLLFLHIECVSSELMGLTESKSVSGPFSSPASPLICFIPW